MLCLVTALQVEARPLINRYKLRAVEGHPYRLYTGDGLRLIVSGIGKVAAGAAVAYQRALLQHEPAAWLNIGIAGHATKDLGSALLAHKITDVAKAQSSYPIFTAAPPCATTSLHTVEHADTTYASNCAYDMEASGYSETAMRFASGEMVHCLKVVSDNPHHPIESLDKKQIGGLLQEQLPLIDEFVEILQELSQRIASLQADPPHFAELNDRWHFTATQKHQLNDILQRWQTLMPARKILHDELLALKTSKEVIKYLHQQLLSVELTLGK